ncbi:16S rRNA (cytosine(967)-C(5))-methyltransferase RsmB [Simiduia curdlanivorans]|uniref:16S rRNA (cytosine(967)-C(5))-methyltransferase n=1 Tax=Simiduia curdlanivorans TaxID=1492769 RepID=A0ABV8UZY7_9GAMM|nr:16S rRNA (cytosine(967)-C(5))-methyltransferase RsmB [Simiduia curdlanivorans]MDN3638012.1 16S rRNA (cytosine(967)-C(5))-methyltransferase RsmB [Simiduia curdlanivorans]
MNSRAIAALCLADLLNKGHSLSALLPIYLARTQARDKGLVQELCFGACRWFYRYNPIIQALLAKPFKPKDADIHALLLLGIYQIEHLRVPDHAALSDTVEACRDLKKDWATKLVNGVLRNFLRQKDTLLATAQGSHPKWIEKAIRSHWPENADAILAANNQHPPLSLRLAPWINRQAYIDQLAAQSLVAKPGQMAANSIELETLVDVTSLPGFNQGDLSVQDEAAQLAGELLPLKDGDRVLDCCCAPGGKTLHLLQAAKVDVVAIDVEAKRLTRVRENLHRAKQQAKIICGDAAKPASWWDNKPFDHILLDAPCSATGVIRRHPDIKLLRKPADIAKLATLQGDILEANWALLKAGGYLLYATCSVMPEENTQVIEAFLARTADAKEQKIDASWGVEQSAGRQILPGQHNSDGFYYCLLHKQK